MAAATSVTKKVQTDEIANDNANKLKAMTQSRPCIELGIDGSITWANELFLKLMGYEWEEIKGKNHSIFVDEAYHRSSEYKEFWASLAQGTPQTGEYRRMRKGGKEIWLASTYYPILGANGRPYCVLQFSTDVTQQKLASADYAGQIAAISKAQAVIEFHMDGTIITANDNFLKALGYSLDEMRGKHHSMFVDEDYRRSAGYKEFWTKLNGGEYVADEFKRIGKGGKEVWIQASYNPIFD
ncbi:MAG: PAS domain-containing protein, partial [Anaerolineales bacterium]